MGKQGLSLQPDFLYYSFVNILSKLLTFAHFLMREMADICKAYLYIV